MTSRLASTLGAALVGALLLIGCGTDDDSVAATSKAPDPSEPASGGAAGTCLAGATDCADSPGGEDNAGGVDEHAALEGASGLIGASEDELPPDVRIGRRGDESFALTEDYRIGRMTAELDDDGGVFRVVSVTVELTDGPVVVKE